MWANEFLDRLWMGIIGDASGPFLAWNMVVIWLDERRWGPPPRPEQTGAEEPRAGCINEQAVLKGTGSCNADEWSLQSRDGRRERKRGEESEVKWALRELRWGKKALICTSDFCKLIYHVSSFSVHHVSSHSTLYMSSLGLNLPVFLWICSLQQIISSHLKSDGSHPSRSSHFTSFYRVIEQNFGSWLVCRAMCREQIFFLCSIEPDWAGGALKVRGRRKHQEMYAHRKHELTRGPLLLL